MADPRLLAFADGRRLSRALLDRWLALSPSDAAALLAVAERLRLGENHLRDVLDGAEDIAARAGSSVAAVLGRPEVSGLLASEMGRNPCLKALKEALRRMRYPQLSATEDRLRELGRRLRLPNAAEIAFPDNLQGVEVTLTVRGASAAELRANLSEAARAVGRAELDEMFRLLGGEA